MLDLELSGKVALVTGGSDGLGRAAAHRLALEGALVVICGRRAAHAQQAAQDITAAVQASSNQSGQVYGLRADVTNSDDCDALIAEILHRHGGIDIFHFTLTAEATVPAVALRFGTYTTGQSPPSRFTAVPVMYEARFELKNATRSAYSSASPMRPIGIFWEKFS